MATPPASPSSPKPLVPSLLLSVSEAPPKIIIDDRKANRALAVSHVLDHDQEYLSTEFLPPTAGAIKPQIPPKALFGIIGVVRFLSGFYVIGIAAATRIFSWLGSDLCAVTKVHLAYLPNSRVPLSEEERKKERDAVASFSEFLDEGGFFFATGSLDLTNSFQRQWTLSADQRAKQTVWERADRRFLWNAHLAQPLISASAAVVSSLCPIIQGHVTVQETQLQGRSLRYALISRRSHLRAGPRLLTRGADPRGCAANFVETEQIVELEGNVSSFVQTRGSIPLLWQQPPSMASMKPKPTLDNSPLHLRTLSRHFNEQIKLYGRQLVLSLIDHHGIEADLAEAFEAYVKLLNNEKVRYVGWDFHEATRGNHYENTSQLLELVREDVLANGYFLGASAGDVVLQQTGVARVNCLDCLDRTNVIESVLARLVLQVQLENLGLLKKGDRVDQAAPELEAIFKNTWVANANAISMEYTGTGALKTEFTLTGNWSMGGALSDGLSSAKRFLQQNFYDETKHVQYQLAQAELELYNPLTSLPEGANNGVFRFRAGRGGAARAVPPVYGLLLELDSVNRTFTTYVLDERRRKRVPLSAIHAVSRCARSLRSLRLTLEHTPAPKEFDFKTVRIREEFAQVLTSLLNTEVPASLLLSDAPQTSPYEAKAQMHVLFWDMDEMQNPPSNLAQVLPRGLDVYFVAIRNCSYRMPEDLLCSLRPAGHFQLLVHSYLGNEYERVAVSAGEQIIVAMFLRQSLWPHCHDVDTHIIRDPRARIRPSPQRRAVSPSGSSSLKGSLEGPTPAYSAAVANVTVTEPQAPPATPEPQPPTATSSFFSMVKGRLLSSPARPIASPAAASSPAPSSPVSASSSSTPAAAGGGNAVGAAISFALHDTTVCVLATTGDVELLRLEGVDLMRDFQHALWVGAFPPAVSAVSVRYPELWTQLTGQLGGSGVLYRTQLPLLSPQSVSARTFTVSGESQLIDFGGASASSGKDVSVLLNRCSFDFAITADSNPLSPKRQPSAGAVTAPTPVKGPELPSILLSDSSKRLEQLEIVSEGPITRKASRGPPVSAAAAVPSGNLTLAPVALSLPIALYPSHYGIQPPCRISFRQLRPLPASPSFPPKGELFLQLEGSFMESVGASTSWKTTAEWIWPDLDLQPFITDKEYLRRRYLNITALSQPDLLGSRTPLGYGRLPLSALIDSQGAAVEFQVGLRLEDEPVGRVSGFGTLIFYDNFKGL